MASLRRPCLLGLSRLLARRRLGDTGVIRRFAHPDDLRSESICMGAATAAEGESLGDGRDSEISGGEIATAEVA